MENFQSKNTAVTSTFNSITIFDNSSDKTFASAKILLNRIIIEYTNIEKLLKSQKILFKKQKQNL